MSGQAKLLIDVGNTSLKYARYSHNAVISQLTNESLMISQIDELFVVGISEVFLCSVKSEELTKHILAKIEHAGLPYTLVETKREEFGIQNAYQQVSNMGSDRWMAIIGASALTSSDIVVIDAGTAITCDFLSNKQHLGGWIAPGLSMLRSSVVKNTQRVFDFDNLPPQLQPGLDTANCVANGALAQIVGMIMQANSIMRTYSKSFRIVLTGGDQQVIFENLKQCGIHALCYDNLVLAGLARISERNNN